MPSTIRIHRVLKSSPEKLYRAFTEAEALSYWMSPFGFLGSVQHIDVRPGGTFRMTFTNFGTKSSHSFGGTYKEVVPNEKLVYTDKFDDPNLPGEITMHVTFKKVLCGTELNIVQEGVPDVIPAEMCYLGWQESLLQLAQQVEPEISDQG